MSEAWTSLYRVAVGLYWLYFASQKWQSIEWMHDLMISTANASPIPGLHEFLVSVVVPHWQVFALGQAAGETLVGILLIVGLGTRWVALLALLLAVNLALTVAFAVSDVGLRWLYYLAVIASAQVIVSGPGPFAVSRFSWVPTFLR